MTPAGHSLHGKRSVAWDRRFSRVVDGSARRGALGAANGDGDQWVPGGGFEDEARGLADTRRRRVIESIE